MDAATTSESDADTRVVDSEGSPPDASAEAAEKPDKIVDRQLPRLVDAVDGATLVKHRDRFAPANGSRLKNSLLGTVGFLELANAGDFAANVWNEVPVPVYAVVLMAVGGTAALVLSLVAFKDVRLSWHNVCFLRKQRRILKDEKVQRVKESQPVRDLDVLLDVTFRELGSETINRCGMDILMGCGAVLIGIGTLMAIGGADYNVWFASNLLSGYIGNTPLAAYGLVNSMWSLYLCRKAHQHKIAGARVLQGRSPMAQLNRRIRNIQVYSVVNGVTTTLGGAGSMITTTMWWGYVILIPVIISSIFCNAWWRRRVGYDRPFVGNTVGMSRASLVTELEFVASARREIEAQRSAPLNNLVAEPDSVASVLEFIAANDLFEPFCLRLLDDSRLNTTLFNPQGTELKIDVAGVLAAPKDFHPAILEVAQKFVGEVGPTHFKHRERYLSDILGSYLHLLHAT